MPLEPIERISNDANNPGTIASVHGGPDQCSFEKRLLDGWYRLFKCRLWPAWLSESEPRTELKGLGRYLLRRVGMVRNQTRVFGIWSTMCSIRYWLAKVYSVARKLSRKMDKARMNNFWAKTAVELALHDAASKTLNRPLIDLIGGKARDRFPVVGGIGTRHA